MENNWAVKIVKSWRLNDLWICDCFPYNLPRGSYPPYPGFDVLKIWLNMNCPSATYEVKNKNPDSFGAVLEVTFNNEEEAMMFILLHGLVTA
jgi:hypothetical protein